MKLLKNFDFHELYNLQYEGKIVNVKRFVLYKYLNGGNIKILSIGEAPSENSCGSIMTPQPPTWDKTLVLHYQKFKTLLMITRDSIVRLWEMYQCLKNPRINEMLFPFDDKKIKEYHIHLIIGDKQQSICIYIYIYRERERERESSPKIIW